MITQKQNSRYKSQMIALLLTMGCFIVAVFSENLYTDADNVNISIVMNGLFGNDPYTIFLHPWLCKLISVIAKLCPWADAYALLMRVLLFVAMWVIFSLILTSNSKIRDKFICILIPITLLLDIEILNYNYTLHAVIFVLVGAAVLITNLHRNDGKTNIILGTVFICIGFMWRKEGALLTIPFICLDAIMEILNCKDRRAAVKRFFHIFTIPIICVGILILIQCSVNNSPLYRDGVAYNSARTAVEDFPVKPYEDICDELEVVSEEEYTAAISWLLMDTDNINTELFEKVAAVGSTNAHPYSFGGIVAAMKDLAYYAVHYISRVLEGILILAFVVLFTGKKNKLLIIIEAILAFGGGGIILIYFAIRGRAIARIHYCILFCIVYILMLLLARKSVDDANETCIGRFVGNLLILICLVGIGSSLINAKWHMPLLAVNSRVNNVNLVENEEYSGDELYIWSFWHKNIFLTYMNAGKLPTQEFMDHNIPAGDWMYGQKYFYEHLSKLNADNPAVALLERKHTYFVGEDCGRVFTIPESSVWGIN